MTVSKDPAKTQMAAIMDDDNLRITSTIWRRHCTSCKQFANGRYAMNCGCPLWGDGCVNSVRVLRQSLQTRNLRLARKRLSSLLDNYLNSLRPELLPVPMEPKTDAANNTLQVPPAQDPPLPAGAEEEISSDDPGLIANAIQLFLGACKTNGVKPPTIRKYRNSLIQLKHFVEADEICRKRKVRRVADLKVIDLDRFRESRKIAQITALKELEVLRAFWAFSVAREFCAKNIAALIKAPTIVDQNDVVPFTQDEVQAMIEACATFGKYSYERSRARAIVLTLRHTALRVSDVALLRRDRISHTKKGWRIFVRTTKNKAQVFLRIPEAMVEALNALPRPRNSGENCPYFLWNGNSKPKSQISEVSETLAAVFKKSGVQGAHAHRFRHTLATELLAHGATFEDVADILGNSPAIVRKHYAKWSPERQDRVDELMERVYGDAW